MKPDQAQPLLIPDRARVWCSQQGRGYFVMILMWKVDDEGESGMVVLRREDDVEEIIGGRMAFHL